MKRKLFRILPLIIVTGGLVASGCASHPQQLAPTGTVTTTRTTQTVVVTQAPPPPRIEAIPPNPPSPVSVWVSGNWMFTNGRWVWMPGHWELRPTVASVWVPGHWDQSPDGRTWVWTQGFWQ